MEGVPLNFGFLAGRDRHNYGDTIPAGMLEKREAIKGIAKKYGTDLRTAALQFSLAPEIVCAVIPGARTGEQACGNARSLEVEIFGGFWEELKTSKLISSDAPVSHA